MGGAKHLAPPPNCTMTKKELRNIARDIQSMYKRELKESYKLAVTYLGRKRDYEAFPAAIKNVLKDLKMCTSVTAKIPNINKDRLTTEVLAPSGLEHFESRFVCELLTTRVPTIDFIFKDLVFLEKEFTEINFDSDNTLSVVTDDIILEDINFGPFRILKEDHSCHLSNMDVSVEAINPNFPPDGGDAHPHPHVEWDNLCAGKGEESLHKALKDGRILDFFQIVKIILNTYGEGPYRELTHWNGVSCIDCGGINGPDDSYSCDDCSQYSCHDCWICCSECDAGSCYECIVRTCNICSDLLCNNCATTCLSCGNYSCYVCLSDYSCCTNICKSCAVVCEQCNCNMCTSCNVQCDSCNKDLCESCNTRCSNCNSSYHNKCEYVCCE